MQIDKEKIALYFPYELKCMVDGKTATLSGIYSDVSCVFHDLVESEQGFQSIKPILKPLCVDELIKMWEENHTTDPDIKSFLSVEFLAEKGFKNIEQMLEYNPDWYGAGTLKLFAKYHLDIYGWISKGLAIDFNKIAG